MPLTRVRNKVLKWSKIDQSEMIQAILRDTEIQEMIVRLNTQDQLFEKGEDKLGRRLDDIGGGYSPYTIEFYKQPLGLPTDRITLRQTGIFYESFHVVAPMGADYIMIIANPMKDGKDINAEWGGNVIGLNIQNKQRLIDELKVRLLQNLRKYIRG